MARRQQWHTTETGERHNVATVALWPNWAGLEHQHDEGFMEVVSEARGGRWWLGYSGREWHGDGAWRRRASGEEGDLGGGV